MFHEFFASPRAVPRGGASNTVRFSYFEVGYLAAELLLKQIENDEIVHGNIWVRSYLIERESCTKPRS